MKSFASAATLIAGAFAARGDYVDANVSNKATVSAVQGDKTLATAELYYASTTEKDAAGFADRNIMMGIKLADGLQWKRLDFAEFWSCQDLSSLLAFNADFQADVASWDNTEYGVPGSFACHLASFITTKYNTQIVYKHAMLPYAPVVDDNEVPSIKFEKLFDDWGKDLRSQRVSSNSDNSTDTIEDIIERYNLLDADSEEIINWYRGVQGLPVTNYE